MAAESISPLESPAAWTARLLRRTLFAIRASLGRTDGRLTLGVTAVLYFVLYSVGLQHLGWRASGVGGTDGAGGTGGVTGSEPFVDLFVVSDPLATATRQVAPFQYETVALLTLGPIEYLFAPVNAIIGVALTTLVGITLAVSVVAWRGPSSCRIGAGAGAAAGIPGLLSGVVCCGPTILLIIGVQASAGLLAAMQWFLPLAVVTLIATLLWVGSRVDLAVVR